MAFISQDTKKEVAPAIKAVLKKYKIKASIGISNHSALVVNIKSGELDLIGDANARLVEDGERVRFFDGHMQVNPYWASKHSVNPVIGQFYEELIAAMKGQNWFDHSDSMTDYFHISYYTHINVGAWNNSYTFIKEFA